MGFSVLLILSAILQDYEMSVRFDRDAIFEGEYFRLISGHYVHLGWQHFSMNYFALVIVFAWYSRFARLSDTILIVSLCPLFISIIFLMLDPQITWYVGISGCIYGLIAFGLLIDQGLDWRIRGCIGFLLVFRIFYQYQFGQNDMAQLIGGQVVIQAHLYGTIFGALFAVYQRVVNY